MWYNVGWDKTGNRNLTNKRDQLPHELSPYSSLLYCQAKMLRLAGQGSCDKRGSKAAGRGRAGSGARDACYKANSEKNLSSVSGPSMSVVLTVSNKTKTQDDTPTPYLFNSDHVSVHPSDWSLTCLAAPNAPRLYFSEKFVHREDDFLTCLPSGYWPATCPTHRRRI